MAALAVLHGTVIDATGADPIPDATILVGADGTIEAVGPSAQISVPEGVPVLDATGGYVIPGLMDANVHLVAARTPDTLLDFEGRYHELVLEAAQITLKYGTTTVFDTWGPPGPTTHARDLINAGEEIGSRIYCAGNIVGLGGPLSADFMSPGNVLEKETVDRINAIWEQGTGERLGSMTVAEIRSAVEEYATTSGVDFIKYAATDHGARGTFLVFSEAQQRAIVEVAREHGLTVQAHTTTVESLRIEVELGADVLQHGDVTLDQPIEEPLLELIAERGLPTAALVVTDRHLEWVKEHNKSVFGEARLVADTNQRNLIAHGARLLLTTDGFAYGPRIKNHPGFRSGTLGDDVPDLSVQLGRSHVHWLAGALERGMSPMEALRSGTSYIAEAYGVSDLVGTLEVGKTADLLVLESDPLADVAAYGELRAVVKGGSIVDREALATDLQLATDPGKA